jgi:hypothetical protein
LNINRLQALCWLHRFRLLREPELTQIGLDNAATVAEMLAEARVRAIRSAARCGWLDGLELRDELGNLYRTIERVDSPSDPTAARVICREGGAAFLWQIDFGRGVHLALPGSEKLHDDATIEALQARVDARSDP